MNEQQKAFKEKVLKMPEHRKRIYIRTLGMNEKEWAKYLKVLSMINYRNKTQEEIDAEILVYIDCIFCQCCEKGFEFY